MRRATIQVILDDDTDREIKEIADHEQISKSAVARRLIIRGLGR